MSNEDTRYVLVPKSAAIMVPMQQPPVEWTAVVCYCHVVETDRAFNASGTGIRASLRILTAFKDAKAGDCVELKEADWKMLQQAMENPSGGYVPQLARFVGDQAFPFTVPMGKILPYIDALTDKATREKPAHLINVAEASPNGAS